MYLNRSKNCLRYFKIRNFPPTQFYHSAGVFGCREQQHVNKFQVAEEVLESRSRESNFYRLVTAFRQYAHNEADINPVSFQTKLLEQPQLQVNRYGLSDSQRVSFKHIINHENSEGTVGEAVDFLNNVYKKHISFEYLHLESEEEIEWMSNRIESLPRETISDEVKLKLANELLKSQTIDHFLANKFPALKRYGGEGAESTMAFFYEFFQLCTLDNLEQIVIGMAHRGRLNFLTGMLNFPPVKLFAKLRKVPDFPEKFEATGDVLSHFISSTDLNLNDKSLHVSLLYNPSHLEAVNPVSLGKTRAKQLSLKDGDYSETAKWSDKVLNVQIHGDAAFAGQGVNQECLIMCRAPHFDVGGSVHLIVNNQIGFTTTPEQGRSSRYSSDLAKTISSPIIHVNGDHPEEVLRAARIAFEYQRKFRKDVFVDMNCYRQWGHNEVDDPTFTNPALYKIIQNRETVPNKYSDALIKAGLLSEEDSRKIVDQTYDWLNDELKTVDSYKPEDPCFTKQWAGYEQAQPVVTTWDTGFHDELLTSIGNQSVSYPKDFNIHPHLLRTHVKNRLAKLEKGESIDWATAEALAFGSLLYDGYNVRICGQDVGRGTFSHRHAMLVDQETNHTYIPLNDISPQQNGFLEIANSILSEEAVLGYEYGMSVENPNNLIIWEAQFGDFFNGAQIIFDTFISSGEAKWLWSSGIVVMLPHGYDGAGPEHSSSRAERFLQLTNSKENKVDGDNVNMQVCQPSTPAQYFHLLRRQMVRNYRKPLIIVAPKNLIRLPAATSSLTEMTTGTSFSPVIGDTSADPQSIKKVIITSGKQYYSLLDYKESNGIKDVALVRLESFCPFPTLELQQELGKYSNAKAFIWSQEEPRNMGAWTFLKPRFENLVGKKIQYSGRDTLPAPAVGIAVLHEKQAVEIVTTPFDM